MFLGSFEGAVADLLGPPAESGAVSPPRPLPPADRATDLRLAMSSPDQIVPTSDVELFSHDHAGVPGSAQEVRRPRISIIQRKVLGRFEGTCRVSALQRRRVGRTAPGEAR
jgi:hypothetical protein